jgi:hypothetical protein
MLQGSGVEHEKNFGGAWTELRQMLNSRGAELNTQVHGRIRDGRSDRTKEVLDEIENSDAGVAPTDAPQDLVARLSVPWHFAGLSMITFGALVILGFMGAARHREGALRTPRVIALAYIAFGLCGVIFIARDPTFLLFLVPGVMVLAASY